jgi:hypothetical protein
VAEASSPEPPPDKQKQRQKQKNAGTLCPERECRLNETGFVWKGNYDVHWDTMIMALTQFKQRERHSSHVSHKHIEHLDGGVKAKLGAWMKTQCYEQRRGRMDAKKEKQFGGVLGVKWMNVREEIDVRKEIAERQFDRNFDLLLAFNEREGHVLVPIKHQESAADDLGGLLGAQRHRYRQGLLKLSHQKWFEVAGVMWESRK